MIQTKSRGCRNALIKLRLLSACFVFAIILTAAPSPARASFVGAYDLGNFTLTNLEADGSAVITPEGYLVITGGNNGSSLMGRTDLFITLQCSGELRFDYSYSTRDFPGFDWAGYVLDSTFNLLANKDGDSGFISLPVNAGQTFGFRVLTEDNVGEPAVLTISNFSGPEASAIPEPGSFALAVLAMAGGIAARRLNRTRAREETTR